MGNPILWSFRRCPYAMRARLAIDVSGIGVEHREILLRDKPSAFLSASPKGTVPVLETESGVIDESLDIMQWALRQNDPEAWLDMPEEGRQWIATIDGPFKHALDRYKYHTRHDDADPAAERNKALFLLRDLDARLRGMAHLFGDAPRLADMAIAPFVRQFANTDRAWFDAQDLPGLQRWLASFLSSARFERIMQKHPLWKPAMDSL